MPPANTKAGGISIPRNKIDTPQNVSYASDVHLHDLIDPALLATRLTERYITETAHPHIPGYRILNYSHTAQFDRTWDQATLTCRGLIIDGDNHIVARPFPKFFNLGEAPAIPDGPFTAHEKLDGSLGIAYRLPSGGIAIATRGSFTSDQALWATEWLGRHPDLLNVVHELLAFHLTPLFEIIYPQNRIVVDYGTREELVFLTAIDITTGRDVPVDWPGARAAHYPGLDLATLKSRQQETNAEGFVLQWPCGTRLKFKYDEYVRLHRLLTGVNARTIWDLLANNHGVDELLEVVPDEFYQWVQATVGDLRAQFAGIEQAARSTLAEVPDADRKTQAGVISRSKYPGIVFSMLDGKPYQDKIWKMIRPSASRPFRADE